MAEKKDAEFEALAARLSDPATEFPAPANVSTGEAAASGGRDFLVSEYGSQEALDAALRSAGRPRLGEHAKGASPTVRGRISQADFEAFKQLEARTGKKQSELVREAVHLLLEQQRMAS